MKILIAGASGLVGSALIRRLEPNHEITRLVRRPAGAGEIEWDPSRGQLSADKLGGFDAVIHLGGESIAEGRWSAAKKQRIRDSRVDSTKLLAERMAQATPRPACFVCASAIGYYGDRGAELLTEDSPAGEGFLPEVCQAWEAATRPAAEAGIRVVNVRIGVVLTKKGAALAKILTPFKLGVGGVVGSGRQYWSGIPLAELVSIFEYCVTNDQISGPVNAVTPNAPTNFEFTKTLGKILGRPTIFPLPGFVARVMLGEMADALLLASARVEPKKLLDTGYTFEYPDTEASLRAALA